MRPEVKTGIVRAFTLVIVSTILVGGFVLAYPNYRRREALLKQDSEIREQIAQKQHEIEKLKQYQTRFKTDPDFVEAIARRNRRVFPGEIIFIFDN